MYSQEKTNISYLVAIGALTGLLIVIVNAHGLFPDQIFYGAVIVILTTIFILASQTVVGDRIQRYISQRRWERKLNLQARKYFPNLKNFVDRFCELPEFGNISMGIMLVLNYLSAKEPDKGEKVGMLKDTLMNNFDRSLRTPINDFRQNLHWIPDSHITEKIFRQFVKDFENYLRLHKVLYIDSVWKIVDVMGHENIPKNVEKTYNSYRENYNHFIDTYTDFAKNVDKLSRGIFSENLEKAHEL